MPITGNTSGGGGRGFIIPTITWDDLKTQIEGGGAIKNFYNVIDRPNSGTDPLTVEVINTGGNAVSDNATILRTREGSYFSHACNYDFLNDVINWEIDTQGNYYNPSFVFNNDTIGTSKNHFETANGDISGINGNQSNNEVIASTLNISGTIESFNNNKIINTNIDLVNANSEQFSNNNFVGSYINSGGTEINNDIILNDIQFSNLDLTGMADNAAIKNNRINLNGNALKLIRGIENQIINTETSTYQNDFEIKEGALSFNQTPSHNWSGIVVADGNQLISVISLDRTCKYGTITNCTIDWTDLDLSVEVSQEVKVIWGLIHPLDTNIDLTDTGAYAEWYNDGTKLIITNVVTL